MELALEEPDSGMEDELASGLEAAKAEIEHLELGMLLNGDGADSLLPRPPFLDDAVLFPIAAAIILHALFARLLFFIIQR